MTARGAKINWSTGGTACYMRHTSSLANGVPVSSGPMTVCGWINVRGDDGGSDSEGHFLFDFRTSGDGGVSLVRAIDADSTFQHSPWSFRCSVNDGPAVYAGHNVDAVADSVSTNENWFYALVWDGTSTVTLYYVKDGGTIASASSGAVVSWNPSDNFDQFTVFSSFHGGNCEVTNIKVFKAALTSGQVDSERTSLLPVYSSDPAVLWAHWKLASAADTTDYSGNSRTLTASGTVVDGSMDPVDLQGGASTSGCLWYGILKA